MKLEYRAFEGAELRIDDAEQTKRISGYAAVFNGLSENLGGFREKIAPGAFAKTIQTADVRFLLNHDGLPLARTKSGTLKLEEDAAGLRFDAEVEAADPDVQRILPKMQRGDLNQMSFGFYVKKDGWDKTNPQELVRTLYEVELFDISLVTFPAYTQTGAHIRSLKDVYDSYLASLQTQEEANKIGRRQALQAHRERKIKIGGYKI